MKMSSNVSSDISDDESEDRGEVEEDLERLERSLSEPDLHQMNSEKFPITKQISDRRMRSREVRQVRHESHEDQVWDVGVSDQSDVGSLVQPLHQGRSDQLPPLPALHPLPPPGDLVDLALEEAHHEDEVPPVQTLQAPVSVHIRVGVLSRGQREHVPPSLQVLILHLDLIIKCFSGIFQNIHLPS